MRRITPKKDTVRDISGSNVPLTSVINNTTTKINPADINQNSNYRFVTDAEKNTWNSKQDLLVSGTNIKTINGTSILGSGNIDISANTSGLTESITILQNTVTGLTETISNITNEVTGNTENITLLQNTVTGLTETISNITNEVTGNTENIINFNNTLTGHTQQINLLNEPIACSYYNNPIFITKELPKDIIGDISAYGRKQNSIPIHSGYTISGEMTIETSVPSGTTGVTSIGLSFSTTPGYSAILNNLVIPTQLDATYNYYKLKFKIVAEGTDSNNMLWRIYAELYSTYNFMTQKISSQYSIPYLNEISTLTLYMEHNNNIPIGIYNMTIYESPYNYYFYNNPLP